MKLDLWNVFKILGVTLLSFGLFVLLLSLAFRAAAVGIPIEVVAPARVDTLDQLTIVVLLGNNTTDLRMPGTVELLILDGAVEAFRGELGVANNTAAYVHPVPCVPFPEDITVVASAVFLGTTYQAHASVRVGQSTPCALFWADVDERRQRDFLAARDAERDRFLLLFTSLTLVLLAAWAVNLQHRWAMGLNIPSWYDSIKEKFGFSWTDDPHVFASEQSMEKMALDRLHHRERARALNAEIRRAETFAKEKAGHDTRVSHLTTLIDKERVKRGLRPEGAFVSAELHPESMGGHLEPGTDEPSGPLPEHIRAVYDRPSKTSVTLREAREHSVRKIGAVAVGGLAAFAGFLGALVFLSYEGIYFGPLVGHWLPSVPDHFKLLVLMGLTATLLYASARLWPRVRRDVREEKPEFRRM